MKKSLLITFIVFLMMMTYEQSFANSYNNLINHFEEKYDYVGDFENGLLMVQKKINGVS